MNNQQRDKKKITWRNKFLQQRSCRFHPCSSPFVSVLVTDLVSDRSSHFCGKQKETLLPDNLQQTVSTIQSALLFLENTFSATESSLWCPTPDGNDAVLIFMCCIPSCSLLSPSSSINAEILIQFRITTASYVIENQWQLQPEKVLGLPCRSRVSTESRRQEEAQEGH